MRVFSTFSGIGAATAAWKPLNWEFVGYAEVDPYACAVLGKRCGATRPKYMPYAERAYLDDELWALANRLSNHAPSGRRHWLIRKYLELDLDPASLSQHKLHELYDRLLHEMSRGASKELRNRESLLRRHRRVQYNATGTVPNFGDIWSITDEDLEELGPIDILEGGSPCQAFSAAGTKQGMMDHRSALMLAYLDLVERMRRINNLQWILWENVKEVLNDPGNGFGTLLGQLARNGGGQLEPGKYHRAGYVSGPDGAVAWRVLDTQRFGRPQRRERVFALGHVGLGTPRRDPREILFDPVREGWRPAPPGKSVHPPVDIPEGSPDPLEGSERLVAFMAGQSASARSIAESAVVCPTLRSTKSGSNMVPRVAYVLPQDRHGEAGDGTEHPGSRYIVRKLQPVEAERLQGFDDGWTATVVNGKTMPDVERHVCLGNTMTVDVMRWIGMRLHDATRDSPKTEAA